MLTSGFEVLCHIRHFVELRINILAGLFHYFDQIFGVFGVSVREEGVGNSFFVTLTSTPYSVHVILRTLRVVEIDDTFYIVNIYKELILFFHRNKYLRS